MKTLFLDCGMGAAGDMLSAALWELLDDEKRNEFLRKINSLGIPGVKVEALAAEKCGITGTHFAVTVNGEEESEHMHEHTHEETQSVHEVHTHEEVQHSHEEHGHHHSHNSLQGIEHIVRDHMNIPDKVKDDIMAVYGLIAEAESSVHGVTMDEIHFHEVGTMDAVADVTAVCLLMEMIAPDEVLASPVHVGSGTVRCAHGILPVPAPATALILKDVPIYGGKIQSELCTPTGAALLKHFVKSFGDMPVMKTDRIGYGMGKKDFERTNCVRAILGSTSDEGDVVSELMFNVDDMTGEEIGFAMETFFEGGALEVFTVPVGMKKSRPGIMMSVMCRSSKKEEMIRLIFRHTTTIGIRENISKRYTLHRTVDTLDTPYGEIRRKVSEGYGVTRSKLEYEDLARASRESGKSISEIRREI